MNLSIIHTGKVTMQGMTLKAKITRGGFKKGNVHEVYLEKLKEGRFQVYTRHDNIEGEKMCGKHIYCQNIQEVNEHFESV